jgi:hypothetical protein
MRVYSMNSFEFHGAGANVFERLTWGPLPLLRGEAK